MEEHNINPTSQASENTTSETKTEPQASAEAESAVSWEAVPTPEDTGDELPAPKKKNEKRFSWRVLLFVTCISVVTSILLTYTLTSAARREEYTKLLLEKQAIIDSLEGSDTAVGSNMRILDLMLELYSYYADSLDEEAMLEAAFKAYVEASGDDYAEYYTEEEYLAMVAENNGDHCGIGVSVINSTVEVNGQTYKAFRVIEIYEESEATVAGLSVGDYIYAVRRDGQYQSVNEIGYDGALLAVRGEEETPVEILVFREEGGVHTSLEMSITRRRFETRSVRATLLDGDPTVGIVSISSFDLTTPTQFKEGVNSLLEQGVSYFVFDVRNNPGGDLQSIKAVLSYFLQEGDLILNAIDRTGEVAASYVAEATSLSGDYAGCSVSAEEIGMYADLDMVVLCNENTASAAEVFTATLRDFQLARTVGQTTFGKGIMQTTRRVAFSNMIGYIKLTTHAYVTACGESYHGIGITPDVSLELSEEAKQYSLLLLPHALDNQLKTAVRLLQE